VCVLVLSEEVRGPEKAPLYAVLVILWLGHGGGPGARRGKSITEVSPL
jgi:hypothetical protein